MNSTLKRHADDLVSILLLAALAIAIAYPVIVNGLIPVETPSGDKVAPWWNGAAPDLNTLEHYGNYVFINASAQRGDSTLWNPYLDTGTPFFAKWRTRCLSPFTMPMYVFPLAIAFPICIFLKIVVSGWTAYYASRRLGVAAPFALTIACAYQLSAQLQGTLVSPISDVLPWIPALFLFTERISVGQLRYWPIGAILWALALLGGAPEAVAGTFVFCALYILIRLYTRHHVVNTSAALAALVASLGIGVALAAVQIIPYLDLIRQSVISESPASPWPLRSPIHWGLVPLMLIGMWISLRSYMVKKQRQRIDALLGASAATMVFALLFVGIDPGIPVLRFMRAEHWIAASTFAILLASAASAETWLELNPEQSLSVIRKMFIVLPVLIIATLLSFLFGDSDGVATSWGILHSLLVFGFVTLFAVTLLKPDARIMGYGLALITIIEVLSTAYDTNVFANPETLFPSTNTVDHLLNTDARVGGSAAAHSWVFAAAGLRQFGSPDSLQLERFSRFAHEALRRPLLYGEAACQYNFITREDLSDAYASVRPAIKLEGVYSSGLVFAQLLTARDRASVIYEGRFVDHFDERLLSAQAPPIVEVNIHFQAAVEKAETPTILDSQTNVYVPIDVSNTGPGLLVLADAFHPGWTATVDGNTTEVIPVNGAFRGVVISPDAQRVEFFYISPTLRLSKAISIITLFLVTLGLYRIMSPTMRTLSISGTDH